MTKHHRTGRRPFGAGKMGPGAKWTAAFLLCLLGFAARGTGDPGDFGTLPLSGEWKFALDKENQGLNRGYHKPEHADGEWEKLKVPGGYSYQGHPGYLGTAWYRKTVAVPEAWRGRQVYLQLPPVDDADQTYWNGEKIGGLDNKHFTKPRLYPVPGENIRWGEKNVIAVQVINGHMAGGFTSMEPAALVTSGPLVKTEKSAGQMNVGPDQMELSATQNLKAELGKKWKPGWRDQGTADTRPKLHARTGPKPGQEALGFEITHPNATGEFVDFDLPPKELGHYWATRDYDFLQFDYLAENTEGEMKIYLNRGGWGWQKGDSGYGTSFPIKKGGWTRVILPFEEFKKVDARKIDYMKDCTGARTVSLGYNNNEMRSAGEVKFANFTVGRFAGKSVEKVPLNGVWHFKKDPDEKGMEKGWNKAGDDYKTWDKAPVGFTWKQFGIEEFKGVAWMKQEVFIPANWKGMSLWLQLGRLQSVGDGNWPDKAEIYFNGREAGATGKKGNKLNASIPQEWVKPGELNTIAVRVQLNRASEAGLTGGPFEISPQPVWVAMRRKGETGPAVISTEFDPGPVAGGAAYELFLRIPRNQVPEGAASMDYELKDCFHRVIASGNGPLQRMEGVEVLELPVALNDPQSRQLYFSEEFDIKVLVRDGAGHPVYAGSRLESPMQYGQREQYALPQLPEKWEETSYGRLKLVDEIEAWKDPAESGVVYKEGGHRKSWVGRRAYSSWIDGNTVKEFQGKKYRELNNNEWFGYRLGRGKIKPGKAYLVRIEYPEDKTRYFPMNVEAGTNYMGLGFRTGVGAGDPFDDYPLSGKFEFCDLVVIPGQKTYGSGGSRSASVENGFWIFFFDTGRAYKPQYQAGPAVSRILVYELPEGGAAHAKIQYPEKAPRRFYVADWEREPEWVARDMVEHALISGYNAISPSILKWDRLAFWHVENAEELRLQPTRPVREYLEAGDKSALQDYLEASKKAGIAIFPRLEYSGTNTIPKEDWAIDKNGKFAKPNRFSTGCSDLLRPAVYDKFALLLDEVIGKNIKDNPQIAGFQLRIRMDRWPISYAPYDVELFARETNAKLPENLKDGQYAKWASDPLRHEQYISWWDGKRKDFHARILKHLQSYRPDLVMLYYNWDPDGWNLGQYSNTPEDYRDQFNMHTSIKHYGKLVQFQKGIAEEEYAKMVRGRALAHHQVRPELYQGMEGFALLGPVNWHYMADNNSYINYFRTGKQLALTKLFNYEERGRLEVQNDNYESSELSSGGRDFAMAEQILACFHGDPWIFTEPTYTYGQPFVDQHRRFAQAFLSLPAVPGTELPFEGANPKELRFRKYTTDGGDYLSAAYIGYGPIQKDIEIKGDWPAGVRLADLVTGKELPVTVDKGLLKFKFNSPPMTLHSFRIDRAAK